MIGAHADQSIGKRWLKCLISRQAGAPPAGSFITMQKSVVTHAQKTGM